MRCPTQKCLYSKRSLSYDYVQAEWFVMHCVQVPLYQGQSHEAFRLNIYKAVINDELSVCVFYSNDRESVWLPPP